MTQPSRPAIRYVDLDLRIDPSLFAYAIDYSKWYEGDWDVMVAAKALVAATGNLPLAVARTVLNCARADPRYPRDLPAPKSGTFIGSLPPALPPGDYALDALGAFDGPVGPPWVPEASDEPQGRPEPSERPRRPLRLVEDSDDGPLRPPFYLHPRWKMRYGRSATKQAKVWHVVNPDKSVIRVFPSLPQRNSGRFSMQIWWVCGRTYHPYLLAEPDPTLPMCRACDRILTGDEYGKVEYWEPMREWWAAEQERLTAP